MSADDPGRTAGGTPSAVPLCEPHDLTMSVHWSADAAGGLRGQVVAQNTGGQACRLPGKPTVRPFGADGTPLPVHTVNTLEMHVPGYVIVQPGQHAAAPVTWRSWCGRPASGQAEIGWADRTVIARVHGSLQPKCAGQSSNLTSSWFTLADLPQQSQLHSPRELIAPIPGRLADPLACGLAERATRSLIEAPAGISWSLQSGCNTDAPL